MSRIRTTQLGLVAVLLLAAVGCTAQEPDVTVNDQVAAADRATEAAGDGEVTAEGEQPGEQSGTGSGGEVVEWVAGNELEYEVAPDTVPAGTELVFELDLAGLPHNVVIENVNDEEPIVEGESAGVYTGEVTLEPGEYNYYCSVAGHRAAGMEGTLSAV